MPTYEFQCNSCKVNFDEVRMISDRDNSASCPKCSSEKTQRVFSVVALNFPGDGWVSKNNRIQGQMRKKNEGLTQRQSSKKRDGEGQMRLVPNVGGEQVESWSEATRLAASKGKDTTGYEKKARESV